mmetsp:Transcript_26908/g.93408  ORF Transcript_26908/g.93408 Transcript_26908/m.93408 type:complete len:210 (-) Transcript_26908:45-674(-)
MRTPPHVCCRQPARRRQPPPRRPTAIDQPRAWRCSPAAAAAARCPSRRRPCQQARTRHRRRPSQRSGRARAGASRRQRRLRARRPRRWPRRRQRQPSFQVPPSSAAAPARSSTPATRSSPTQGAEVHHNCVQETTLGQSTTSNPRSATRLLPPSGSPHLPPPPPRCERLDADSGRPGRTDPAQSLSVHYATRNSSTHACGKDCAARRRV